MVRLLLRVLINLATAAIGLLVAAWLVDGVRVTAAGFVVAVVVFAAAQAILSPFIFNIARQHAAPILGGIGLVSTLVALLVATLFSGGLTISGVLAWVLAPLVVWIVTALGGWVLGALVLKNRAERRREKRAA
ncbi:MAG TPA: phage holin family protein [Cellulomonas sp.]